MSARENEKALLLAVRPFAQSVVDQTAQRLESVLKRLAVDLPQCIAQGGAIGRKSVEAFAGRAAEAAAAQSDLADNLAGPKKQRRDEFGVDMVSRTNIAEVKAKAKKCDFALISDGARIINQSLESMGNGAEEWTEFQTRLLAFVEASIKLLADNETESDY